MKTIHDRYQRWEVVRAKVPAPDRPSLHAALAVCLRGTDLEGARDLALVILAFEIEDGLAWSALGAALAGMGQEADAEAAFERALLLRDRDAPAAFGLARLLQARGQTQRALTVLSRFANLAPAVVEGGVFARIQLLHDHLVDVDTGDSRPK